MLVLMDIRRQPTDQQKGSQAMRRIARLTMVLALVSGVNSAARAADALVPFTGLVTSTCVLTVGTPGVLGANSDFSVLSSSASGGVAGTVSALSTGTTFKVSAIAPTAFSIAPDGGNTGVTFAATYSGTGSTSIGTTPGDTQSTLATGVTLLTVNLEATKSSGPFPGGAYTTEVTVRCE